MKVTRVEFVDELPKSGVGKVLRRDVASATGKAEKTGSRRVTVRRPLLDPLLVIPNPSSPSASAARRTRRTRSASGRSAPRPSGTRSRRDARRSGTRASRPSAVSIEVAANSPLASRVSEAHSMIVASSSSTLPSTISALDDAPRSFIDVIAMLGRIACSRSTRRRLRIRRGSPTCGRGTRARRSRSPLRR